MKIIFLDLDGVLTSAAFLLANPGGMDRLDPAAVERLNRIIDRTGAKVVVSSAWRPRSSLAEIAERLAALGFRGEILDRTPDLLPGSAAQHPLSPHCQQVRAWLRAHPAPVKRLLILDSANLEGAHLGAFGGNIVNTEFATGLLDEHVEPAVRILGERS